MANLLTIREIAEHMEQVLDESEIKPEAVSCQLGFHNRTALRRLIIHPIQLPPWCIPRVSRAFGFDRQVLTYSVAWHHMRVSREYFHELFGPIPNEGMIAWRDFLIDLYDSEVLAPDVAVRTVLQAIIAKDVMWTEVWGDPEV